MNPIDFEHRLQNWTPRAVSPRIGRRLFGRNPESEQRRRAVWFAPLATACAALTLSLNGLHEPAGARWVGTPLFQTNENQITVVALVLDQASLANARPDRNRWTEASFQSTNDWALSSTNAQF